MYNGGHKSERAIRGHESASRGCEMCRALESAGEVIISLGGFK